MALSLTNIPSSNPESRSTENSPKLDPLYSRRPPASSIALRGEQVLKLIPPADDDLSISEPPTPSDRKRKRVQARSLRYSSDEEEEVDKFKTLNAKLDLLISNHQTFQNAILERMSSIEKKVDKLQTDVAFLGSRATEGRPLTTPVYPFGEASISLQKPPSTVSMTLDVQKSWNDFGL